MTKIKNSMLEYKNLRTLTTVACFIALNIILSFFQVKLSDVLQITFTFIPDTIVAFLFGPMIGLSSGFVTDVSKAMIHPSGGFVILFTFIEMFSCFLYGCILYKEKPTLARVSIAMILHSLIINVVLNSLCLSLLYNKAIFALLPPRVIKNLLALPIEIMITYFVLNKVDKIKHKSNQS